MAAYASSSPTDTKRGAGEVYLHSDLNSSHGHVPPRGASVLDLVALLAPLVVLFVKLLR